MYYFDLNCLFDFIEFVYRYVGILGRYCWFKVFFMIIFLKKKKKKEIGIFLVGVIMNFMYVFVLKKCYFLFFYGVFFFDCFFNIFEFEFLIK